MLSGDVNLQRIFFMLRTFFSITAAAAAVTKILPICVGDLIFIIFRRGLQRCNTFSSLLLFNQLKEVKEEI
jgi:hypothetical protein